LVAKNKRARREEKGIMGKTPVRLKEVSYSLSPMHHHAMRGLLKDFSYKSGKRIFDNWVSALFLLVPVYGSYWYSEHYREMEKLHHRD